MKPKNGKKNSAIGRDRRAAKCRKMERMRHETVNNTQTTLFDNPQWEHQLQEEQTTTNRVKQRSNDKHIYGADINT